MTKYRAGFTIIELLMLLALSAAVIFVGLYVYESRTNKPLTIQSLTNPKAKKIVAVGDIVCDPKDPYLLVKNFGYCQDTETYSTAAKINPDAVLALGDLQYNDGALDKFPSRYDKSWGQLKSITYPVAGNHEYGTPDAAGYFNYFDTRAGDPDKGYYSFDIGEWHFIALNSNCDQIGGCGEGSRQLQWLKQDLARNNSRQCSIAFWHHPRFTSGKYSTESSSRNLSSAFWAELIRSRADVVFNGHDHLYERFSPQNSAGEADINGLRQFTVGTGGKSLYKKKLTAPNSEVLIDDSYGVLVIELYSKAYRWQFISTENKVLDSGTQSCT